MSTCRHALDVLKRFRSPAGTLGEQWLTERETRLFSLIRGAGANTVAGFWTGGRGVSLHAARDALWKLERE